MVLLLLKIKLTKKTSTLFLNNLSIKKLLIKLKIPERCFTFFYKISLVFVAFLYKNKRLNNLNRSLPCIDHWTVV